VFTELTFRIHPRAEASRGRAFSLPTVDAGIEALRVAMREGWKPAVARLYDATEAGRNFQAASDGKAVLLVMSEGPAALVDVESRAVRAIVEASGGEDLGEEPVRSWLEHRNRVPSFESLLEQGLVADTIEVAIAWDKLPTLFADVVTAGSRIEGMIAVSGHISHCYTQGANIYFTFVGAHSDLDAALALYDSAWETTMAVTHELGGTIAHHHGIGRVRKGWLKKELGAAYEVLVGIKRALDPDGILNPGVLVDVE
jgi:alkyldihydroxyacetonephosphate synthase